MPRGIMYHITSDPENLGNMSEWSFYEDLRALNVDFVRDQSPEDACTSVERLIKKLMNAGFTVSQDKSPDGDPAWRIEGMNEEELLSAKRMFFKSRFEAAKRTMEKLTLEQFSTESSELWEVERLMRERASDMVFFGNENGDLSYTLDGAIRRFEPDTTYWLAGNTVLLH